MDNERKFSLTVRIDHVTPAHVYLSLFCAMILNEYDHGQATRGKAGMITVRAEEFKPFLDHINPHLISVSDLVPQDALEEYTGLVFTEFQRVDPEAQV
jgi:hypothetical protein